MPCALKTMVFAAAILVTVLTGTTGFPVRRSRANISQKLSTTVDTSSLMSTGRYLDNRYDSVDVGGRLFDQNIKLAAGSNVQTKNLVYQSSGVYEFPLHDDSIASETEAIISIEVTKQDLQKSVGFGIEQKDNTVDGDSVEYNTELRRANQAPMDFELHHLPTDGFIQPEHWLLVKDFIMDDYLFGELDESAREYFLRRILSGLILSQQTR